MKRIAFLLVFVCLLSGCRKEETPVHRVVTRVQVQYSRQEDTIRRVYTQPANMQSVLTYLRILQPHGPAVPKDTYDTTCEITLQYSDGSDRVYYQLGNRYIRRDEGGWEYIDSSRATLLYPMLLLLPSDT
ncbi:MAG: hypothetical protein E7421_06800 [Ruminococcaceae bacterium]|nr:hypothetical protein [Oscillospiraceae bacterium]